MKLLIYWSISRGIIKRITKATSSTVFSLCIYIFFEKPTEYSLIPRFNGALSLEISNDHPNMRIIRRKVALILGQWVSEVLC